MIQRHASHWHTINGKFNWETLKLWREKEKRKRMQEWFELKKIGFAICALLELMLRWHFKFVNSGFFFIPVVVPHHYFGMAQFSLPAL